VLVSKSWTDNLLEVIIDVGKIYAVASAIGVEILEELIAGDIDTSLENVGEASIVQIDGMVDAALALEGERDVRTVDLYVPITHGGETVGFVFASVSFVAYADECVLHQANDGDCRELSRRLPGNWTTIAAPEDRCSKPTDEERLS
jgi:hypothetical protein